MIRQLVCYWVFVVLIAGGSAACWKGAPSSWKNPWQPVSAASVDDQSQSRWVQGDYSLAPDAPQSDWRTWVVLHNPNEQSVYVAFRAINDKADNDKTEYYVHAVGPNEVIALRVGPGDVEFFFIRTTPEDSVPQPPKELARITGEDELARQHPEIRRI